MTVLISTNMYVSKDFDRVLTYVKEFDGKVGVEVFPMFHEPEYEKILQTCAPLLSKVPISFHGPYYHADYSAPYGSECYEKTMKMTEKTLEYCQNLKSKYMVFHHNNFRVSAENKQNMIENACINFRKVEKMYADCGISVVVENAGVLQNGSMLLDQNEFINLCKKEDYRVLIDIGHAHANGWDLCSVMEALKERIAAYHLHNNDGVHDSHQRICDGTLDFDSFFERAKELTPSADLVLEYNPKVPSDEQGIMEDIKRIMQ